MHHRVCLLCDHCNKEPSETFPLALSLVPQKSSVQSALWFPKPKTQMLFYHTSVHVVTEHVHRCGSILFFLHPWKQISQKSPDCCLVFSSGTDLKDLSMPSSHINPEETCPTPLISGLKAISYKSTVAHWITSTIRTLGSRCWRVGTAQAR